MLEQLFTADKMIPLECFSMRTILLVLTSHTLIMPSSDPEINKIPWESKAKLQTAFLRSQTNIAVNYQKVHTKQQPGYSIANLEKANMLIPVIRQCTNNVLPIGTTGATFSSKSCNVYFPIPSTSVKDIFARVQPNCIDYGRKQN